MSYTKNTTAKTEQRAKAWTDLTGTMRVYGKERESSKGKWMGYSTSIGKKQEDGTYKNCFFNVRFASKDIDPEKEGNFEIAVNKAFLTADIWKDTAVPVIVIQDFDFV